jgi:hypothetical protein
MTDQQKPTQAKRQELIEDLSRNIIESAKPLIDAETRPEDLQKEKSRITERLAFEANVAMSEVVTRFARRKKTQAEQIVEERTCSCLRR